VFKQKLEFKGGKMMKKTCLFLLTLMMVFGITMTASAGTVNLSMDPTTWDRYPVWLSGINYNTSPATIEKTAAGYLKGTKTTGTGGTNWILGLETNDSYDFQNATLHYKWLMNGQGTYSGMYSGIRGVVYNVDPNSPYAGFLTTGWSWAGSEVIPSNQWLYTEFVFSESGYDFAVSKTGYGNKDFLYGSKTYGSTTWDALADAHVYFQFGDNYAAYAYFEVAEASVITQEASVPEPATMLLLGSGLIGLAGYGRRKFFKK
jgi:hypothetical protein